MSFAEILLIGVGLSMDAFAVGMTDGMVEPLMRARKAVGIALTFAVFQFLMPLLGYFCGTAFADLVALIAPYLSLLLLGFIGGKMLYDGAREGTSPKAVILHKKPLKFFELIVQGIATSLDALAVGVTLLAAETAGGLPVNVFLCSLLIGETTLALSLSAVQIGRVAGNKFSDRAGEIGGIVLILIGLKIFLEGVF